MFLLQSIRQSFACQHFAYASFVKVFPSQTFVLYSYIYSKLMNEGDYVTVSVKITISLMLLIKLPSTSIAVTESINVIQVIILFSCLAQHTSYYYPAVELVAYYCIHHMTYHKQVYLENYIDITQYPTSTAGNKF